MSKLNFLHDVKNRFIKDDKVQVDEEYIIDGPKGLTIKYYHKEGTEIEKITISGKDDNYKMVVISGGDKKETSLSKSDLAKEIGKNKKLGFAKDFLKTQKGGRKGSKAKKGSTTKKSSKTKKGSRTKKGSKGK
jgi:hypothetical protein